MAIKTNVVRVRFAPSPTGFLHIGGARTALFNWLFARREGGACILRIEDTDMARSEKRFEKDIIECFRWLGIDWDEGPDIEGPYGPYRQSERLGLYETYLTKMLKEGHAYYCFCTKEELEREHDLLLTQGLVPRYSGRCGRLSYEEREKLKRANTPSVIRVRTPGNPISFHDEVRGNVRFEASVLEDFIIAKDLESPLYNFAATVDDYEMKISHVIRGEEHLANTPRQIILQHILKFPTPHYAHLPLILNADRTKLSKRFSDTALHDYKNKGYLPETIVNFMALLGWHPTTDRELFTKEELSQIFELSRVQKAGAVFNEEKLNWMNGRYIRALSDAELFEMLKLFAPLLQKTNLNDETLKKIVHLEKERMKTLADFGASSDFFFTMPAYEKELLVWKQTPLQTIKENLEATKNFITAIPDEQFEAHELQTACEPVIKERGRGEVLWPLRVALSGKKQSPPPFHIMGILGKQESIQRINHAIEKL